MSNHGTYWVSYAGTAPVRTKARTLAGAKRAAVRHCIFIGQDMYVLRGESRERLEVVASRHADALDMSVRGRWQDVG